MLCTFLHNSWEYVLLLFLYLDKCFSVAAQKILLSLLFGFKAVLGLIFLARAMQKGA